MVKLVALLGLFGVNGVVEFKKSARQRDVFLLKDDPKVFKFEDEEHKKAFDAIEVTYQLKWQRGWDAFQWKGNPFKDFPEVHSASIAAAQKVYETDV